MKNKYAKVWDKLHKYWAETQNVVYDNWLSEYETIINKSINIIDLGCGGSSASNTRYLLSKRKNVISCDISVIALSVVQKIEGAKTKNFDMLETFPFEDDFADIIVADLSLHYFTEKDTFRIMEEIKRVLKKDGYLFFRLNSVQSTEYKNLVTNKVHEIEPRLFFTKNIEKRFFDKNDVIKYFSSFKLLSLSEENMTRWSSDKIVWKGAVQNIKD